MDNQTLTALEMVREEDMLLAGLRRYWGTAQLDDPSEAELMSSQSQDNLRTPEELVIRRYGDYFLPAFKEMQDSIVGGMQRLAQWHAPALFLTPEHLCLLTFKAMMPSAYPSRDGDVSVVGNRIKLQTAAENLAGATWNLLHYMRAKDENAELWEFRSRLIKNWTDKKQRRFVQDVLGMTELPKQAKLAFGVAMLQCITDAVTDEQVEAGEYFARRHLHWDGKARTTYIEINPRLVEEMIDDHQLRQWLRPKWAPMVCAPNPWAADEHGHWSGGYLIPGMQMKFVRPASPGHDNYGKTEPGIVAVNAINRLQSTPYTVNEQVLEVMKITFGANIGLGDCPESAQDELKLERFAGVEKHEDGTYTEEFKLHLRNRELTHDAWAKAWADRLRMVQRLDMARDMLKYPAYWLPITMDFRGRCYTSTEMLSPQGSDFDKGLCCFAEAKPYTDRGRYWMKVQIANLFGEDKISFDDRVAWFDQHEAELRAIAEDPITNHWWSDEGDDKKKWQLLASILDYFREDGMNQVAVQMDGSCNGIQHWSAIGRDLIGAKATNLLPSEKPEDLYSEVALFANNLLAESRENDWHSAWRDYGVSRKCAKRPCMTYPYGVTLRGCVDSLKKDGMCDWAGDEKAQAAQYIGMILMEEAIPGVVSASYKFMAWAKDLAKQANTAGTYVEWITPLGTLVRHNYYVEDRIRLDVTNQRVWFEVPNLNDARLSTKEMVSGIAPNFVHSLDASHMLATINAMWDDGLHNFSMIHDSYGCHACDVDGMQRHIREQFVRMYTLFDPATLMAERMAEKTGLEPVLPPENGELDINLVLEAPYFFA
jgi:DNA-directed RNA polymerase